MRFNCRDKGLGLLSDPVLVEDIVFSKVFSKAQDERIQKDFRFTVDRERIEDNQVEFFQEFRRGKSSVSDSETLAVQTAHSFSGIALWPRIILDDLTVINSRRFQDGGRQRSHWQTVLPIMTGRPIPGISGGEEISISCDFSLPSNILKPPSYSIEGQIKYK